MGGGASPQDMLMCMAGTVGVAAHGCAQGLGGGAPKTICRPGRHGSSSSGWCSTTGINRAYLHPWCLPVPADPAGPGGHAEAAAGEPGGVGGAQAEGMRGGRGRWAPLALKGRPCHRPADIWLRWAGGGVGGGGACHFCACPAVRLTDVRLTATLPVSAAGGQALVLHEAAGQAQQAAGQVRQAPGEAWRGGPALPRGFYVRLLDVWVEEAAVAVTAKRACAAPSRSPHPGSLVASPPRRSRGTRTWSRHRRKRKNRRAPGHASPPLQTLCFVRHTVGQRSVCNVHL